MGSCCSQSQPHPFEQQSNPNESETKENRTLIKATKKESTSIPPIYRDVYWEKKKWKSATIVYKKKVTTGWGGYSATMHFQVIDKLENISRWSGIDFIISKWPPSNDTWYGKDEFGDPQHTPFKFAPLYSHVIKHETFNSPFKVAFVAHVYYQIRVKHTATTGVWEYAINFRWGSDLFARYYPDQDEKKEVYKYLPDQMRKKDTVFYTQKKRTWTKTIFAIAPFGFCAIESRQQKCLVEFGEDFPYNLHKLLILLFDHMVESHIYEGEDVPQKQNPQQFQSWLKDGDKQIEFAKNGIRDTAKWIYVKRLHRIYYIDCKSISYDQLDENGEWIGSKELDIDIDLSKELYDERNKSATFTACFVLDRIITIFCWSQRQIYCIDINRERMLINEKELDGFDYVRMSLYDEINGKIYLLTDDVDCKHKMVDLIDVIPMEMRKEDLCNGFIRKMEQLHCFDIPQSLMQLVLEFYC